MHPSESFRPDAPVELHPLTKLYQVTFYEISGEDEDMYSEKHVRIMPQVDDFKPFNLGSDILSNEKLPRAEDGGVPALDSVPFEMNRHYFVITDCNHLY